MLEIVLALAAGGLLAYANGANDVSKSIATLVGSGVGSYSHAVLWGTLWTAAGAALANVAGAAMLTTFGAGLLNGTAELPGPVAIATLLGASGWIVFATRTGLPVSTTHALVGALVGTACWSQGAEAIRWSALGGKIFVPLLLSPLVALALTGTMGRLLRRAVRSGTPDCICVERIPSTVTATSSVSSVAALAPINGLVVRRGRIEECSATQPQTARVTIDHLHWLTSGATALARGLNDTPKLVALMAAGAALQVGTTLPVWLLFTLVGVGMVGGSLLAGRRVTEVLANKVTVMDHHDGFVANGVTAALVSSGAVLGLPMSTTHVSSGAIFGAGAVRGTLNMRLLRDIVLAWVVTLPFAGLLGIVAFGALRGLLT